MLFNEWMLGYHISPYRTIHEGYYRIIVIILQFNIFILGILFLKGYFNKFLVGFRSCFLIGMLFILTIVLLERTIYAFIYPSCRFQVVGDLISKVDTQRKVVALTYDDGPSAEYTPELLNILDKYNVKATFFMVGKNIELNKDLVGKIKEKGHQLANHSFEHRKMVYLAYDEMKLDIERTNQLLRSFGIDYEIYFRAPYGEKALTLPRVLRDLNMKHIMWDVDSKDWQGLSSDRVVANVLAKVSSGSIILMHDAYIFAGPSVAKSTERIIVALFKHGYQFKTVSQLLSERGGR